MFTLPRTARNLLLVGAMLIPSFASAETLTIYSSRQTFLLNPILEALTQKTETETEVLYAKKGILERLEAEGDGSPATLVISNDILLLEAISEKGLAERITDQALLDMVPSHLRNSDHQWVGLSLRGRIVYVNKNEIAEGEIADYLDLMKPQYAGRICIRPWTHPYNIGLVAYIISKLGEDAAAEWVQKVNGNLAREPKGNDRAQIRGANSGECDIAIANSYYLGVMQSDPKQVADTVNIQQIFPTLNKNYGAMPALSGALVLKTGTDKKAAYDLLKAMASQKGQALYTAFNHELPIKPEFAAAIHLKQAEALDTSAVEAILPYRKKALEIIERLTQ